MKKICLLFSAVQMLFLHSLAQPAPAWVRTYNAAGQYDAVRAMAIDKDNNIYVMGPSEAKKNNADYVVVKYSPSGEELKVFRYNGVGNGEDFPYAMAVDDAGNVYITGRSMSKSTGYDMATVKFSSTGAKVWAQTHNGTSNLNDIGRGIHVDGSGNVYVVGSADGPDFFAGKNIVTVKYASDGSRKWTALFNNIADDAPTMWQEEGNAVVADLNGNVYVTGRSEGAIAIKYNSNGSQEWVRKTSGTNGRKIALDDQGNLIMASWAGEIAKLDAAEGTVLWSQIDAHATAYQGMVLDASGNIYATGWGRPGNTKDDFITIKRNSAGSQQWIKYYNGNANDIDLVHGITLDNDNNVFVAGYTRILYGKSSISQYATVKYDNNGNEKWIALYVGPEKQGAEAFAIVADTYGNVYVGGQNAARAADINFATIRYSQTQNARILHSAPIVNFRLNNYPNPFYQSTTIEFQLEEKGKVTLAVYDLLGKEITTLLNEEKGPGRHKVIFDASTLSAGTYLYRFQMGEIVETRRLVLVR